MGLFLQGAHPKFANNEWIWVSFLEGPLVGWLSEGGFSEKKQRVEGSPNMNSRAY